MNEFNLGYHIQNKQRPKPVWKSPNIFPTHLICKLNFHLKNRIHYVASPSPSNKRKRVLRGRSLCVYLSVCLSDCPHALIGRQPSRDVFKFLYMYGCEGGGTTDCRHACERFFGFSVKPPLFRQRDKKQCL
jgi:hypothetical protein